MHPNSQKISVPYIFFFVSELWRRNLLGVRRSTPRLVEAIFIGKATKEQENFGLFKYFSNLVDSRKIQNEIFLFHCIKTRSHDPILGSENWKQASDGPISRFRFVVRMSEGHL